eukprot:NODE_45_length_32908_cov_0.790271.p14 type:complete len:284 gc:universal NODE_45_length_32908_cov_0.790271:30014-29163(-)
MIDLFIDSLPAILLVNEPEENDLMQENPRRTIKPPARLVVNSDEEARALSRIPSFRIDQVTRPHQTWLQKIANSLWTFKNNEKDDSLIDLNLMLQSYTQIGLIQMIGGTISFFLVFYLGITQNNVFYNISPSQLWGNRTFPVDASGNYTQINNVTYDIYSILYAEAAGAYWLNIVFPQVFDLFIVKLKIDTINTTRIFKNKTHFMSIPWSIGVSCLLLYTPGLQDIFGVKGPRWQVWMVAIGTGMGIIAFDFVKKSLFKRGYFGGIRTRPADKIDGISRVLTR